MMSGHINNQNKKKNKGGSHKGIKSTGRHKPDDEISPMSAQENTNMLKAALKVGTGVATGTSSHSSPTKDSPLLKVDELFPAASARVEERVDYWQEDEVQKFMQSNPQVETSSPINRTHNYLAGTFNLNSPADHCSESRSVFTTVTAFFRDSIIAASSGSRNGGESYHDTTTSPSEETETWTMLLPLKRFVLRTITVVLYICDAVGIQAALTEKAIDFFRYETFFS